jgi:glutamate N-acetyltransferase/amino-acid N-acetyltransferase
MSAWSGVGGEGAQGHPSGGPNHPVVVDPDASAFLDLPNGVERVEPEGRSPGITHPLGFLAAGVAAGIKESGRPDVGLVVVAPEFRHDVVSAAVFTRNAFAAAPVVVTQRETSLTKLVAVVMNSGNANACTGAAGLATARAMQAACGEALGVPAARIGVASTGVIGVPLDTNKIVRGIKEAVSCLSSDGGPYFAETILTTDRFAKTAALDVRTRDGLVRLAATAKGAGMISPGMATMLCMVTTDAGLSPAVARSLLVREVGRTLNRISVDGQMSTNDCVLFLANGASGVTLSADGAAQLGAALRALLLRISLMMVADGEGATKVIRLRVRGAGSDEEARLVARAVADSSLVKTAMYGCDPNWGRILSAAGAVLPGRAMPNVMLIVGGVQLVEEATAVDLGGEETATLEAVMAGPEVDILLDLGVGASEDEVYFSDLGHEYVTVNADYHT